MVITSNGAVGEQEVEVLDLEMPTELLESQPKANKRGNHFKRYTVDQIEAMDAEFFTSLEKFLTRTTGDQTLEVAALVFGKYNEWIQSKAMRKIDEFRQLAESLGYEIVPKTASKTAKTTKASQA